MMAGWAEADLAKVSEEELAFLSGEVDLACSARALWHPRLRLLVITRGPAGCAYFASQNPERGPESGGVVPGFTVKPVDTTGAGDGFVAGLLAGLLDCDLHWEAGTLERALRLGNAVGALTTTQKGAIPALPTRAAVEALVAS